MNDQDDGRVLVTRCTHCKTTIDESAVAATSNARRLQEHLLGCPAALAACTPALPIFRNEDELASQFIFECVTPAARDC